MDSKLFEERCIDRYKKRRVLLIIQHTNIFKIDQTCLSIKIIIIIMKQKTRVGVEEL